MAAADGRQDAAAGAGRSACAQTAALTHHSHFILQSFLFFLSCPLAPRLHCLLPDRVGRLLGRVFGEVEFEAVGVVAAEVVVAHLPGLEEAEPRVEAEGGQVDALRLQHDLVHLALHSPHELVEQLHPDAQSAVGRQHHQHRDVGLARVAAVQVPDYAPDDVLPQVRHHRQFRPVLHEVVVGED